jgi:hypothetical protein
MTADGSFTCTVDRIVDDSTAVLLLERDDDVVDQLDIDAEALPADGRHEGASFDVDVSDGSVVALEYRPDRERERRERLQDRFDRLSERLGDES